MQAVNNSIIYQLTNVGATQQLSPLKTPKKNPASRKDQLTPSPSSKGKKWTEKLAKFQRSSAKKGNPFAVSPASHPLVRTPTISDEPGNAKTPYSPPSNQLFTSRTSSLPRPNSSWCHNISGSTPSSMGSGDTVRRLAAPRVIPFGYSKDRISPKKSFLNEICTICDEPISNKSSGEKVIELECSHIFHQECLLLSIGTSGDTPSNDLYNLFPPCRACLSETGAFNRCIPRDAELRDRLISGFLLNRKKTVHLETPTISPNVASGNYKGQLATPVKIAGLSQVRKQSLMAETPTASNSMKNISLASAPTRRQSERVTRNGISAKETKVCAQHVIRGSYFAASPSIVSSVAESDSFISNDASQACLTLETGYNMFQLPILRTFYIKTLLRNSPTKIIDWEIDDKFGLLRCVDKLVVSKDGFNYTPCLCYLFEKRLVVCLLIEKDHTRCSNILENRFESVEIYGPLSNAKVTTFEASVLRCTIQEHTSDNWQKLFLKESLNSNSSKIIQKWISGLLDFELLFKETDFSSTLTAPLMIENMLDCKSDECRSFTGLVSPRRLIEVTAFNQGHRSVIMKRAVDFFTECDLATSRSAVSYATNATNTISTVMTSISRILSLKRETPDDLVIVLQLDYEKLKKDNGFKIIDNSLRALNSKFLSLKLCLVDSDGFLIDSFLLGSHHFTSVMEMASCNSDRKFEPQWLKNKYYPGGLTQNVGIAVISNSSMQNGKSSLLLDYDSFTCGGRRRPNELKVKIGYLNADYSDRVNDLVEVESWNDLLEAVSYSFSIYFGDDDDDNITDCEVTTDENCVSDTEESEVGDEGTTISDTKSSTVVRSLSNSNIDHLCGRDSFDSGLAFLKSPRKEDAVRYLEFSNEQNKAKHLCNADDVWDPLFNDIEQAIKEMEQLSPMRSANRESFRSFICL